MKFYYTAINFMLNSIIECVILFFYVTVILIISYRYYISENDFLIQTIGGIDIMLLLIVSFFCQLHEYNPIDASFFIKSITLNLCKFI